MSMPFSSLRATTVCAYFDRLGLLSEGKEVLGSHTQQRRRPAAKATQQKRSELAFFFQLGS